jgi:hypothetical protein
MGIDLEAIRRKLAELKGEKKQSEVQLWKPGIGDYKIRIIPWQGREPSEPFVERTFYFIPNQRQCLAPSQFGKPDPVQDLRMRLFKDGAKEAGKKLMGKTYAYAKVIVRGEEEKGLMVWKFPRTIHQRLLGFYIDEDGGDVTDLDAGFDLKVKIFQEKGKQFLDTTVDLGRQGPAHKDPTVVKAWFEKKIDVDELHRSAFKEQHEIESMLEAWLTSAPDQSTGTQKGGNEKDNSDNLDKLTKELAEAAPREVKVSSKPVQKAEPVKDISDLDAAFDELMND